MPNAWIIKPLAFSDATASSTALGLPSYVGNDFAGVVWRSADSTVHTFTLDMGADVAFDTVMLFGVDGAQIDVATAAVRLATNAQGSGFNGAFTSSGVGSGNHWDTDVQPLLAGSVRPKSAKGSGLFDCANGPPPANRYVSIVALMPTGALEISRIVIGKRIALNRNYGFGGGLGVRDLGSLDFSARGVLQRRRARKLRTAQLTFSNVERDEVESYTKPLLEQIGNTEMIALVTDPAIDPQRQNRCYYGPLVGDLANTQRNARFWEARVNLVSIF